MLSDLYISIALNEANTDRTTPMLRMRYLHLRTNMFHFFDKNLSVAVSDLDLGI